MKSRLIRDVPALVEAVARGDRPKYLFFWGHRPQRDGSVGKGSLSQWWPSPFVLDGVHYPTAEHYMMAEKARLFGDDESLSRILSTSNPGSAKQLGRLVRGFTDAVWNDHRFDIVVRGNRARFEQNRELGLWLVNTGDRVLVEASPVDRVWGIGLAEDDARAEQPDRWRGLNLLGFALMEVRQLLQE